MKQADLEILKEKIIEEVNDAVDAREDSIDTIVEVDENNEDALYAVIRAKFTYDGYYNADVDYFETTSISGSLVELSLFENNKNITTPDDFLREIERDIA